MSIFTEVIPPCRKCGNNKDIIVYPDDHALTICPTCCKTAQHPDGEDGHQFEYQRDERRHICKYCGIPRDCTDWEE